ncbi:MAG TPA: aminotransferase class I/II-fold pyridoxal phosphate-dependent enzyme, partial [Thermomicrobiales bacterium]|nr:aminotransferase class I/II-fold pyridoxal phosphate-dependent enzyme [Thermomicrobiales bacterium]
PGLRIGWIAATEEIVRRCWGTRDYISLAPARLSDALADVALKLRDQIVARNHEIVAANLAAADRWFAEHADLVSWTRPHAGLLALMRYHLDVPSLDLSNKLAADYSVMLAPGSAFGFEGHLRIGIGQTQRIFEEGLNRTAACLQQLQREEVARRAVAV